MSDGVDRVVRRALARDPDDRYAKATDFSHELLAATERGDATSMLAPPPPRPLRRGRTWSIDSTVALLAVVAVLIGTLILFASFQGRGATGPGSTPTARTSAATAGAPNVLGKTVADAVAQLLAAGFGSVGYDVENGATGVACSVARQQPAAGASFSRGGVATVWYVPGKDCLKGVKGKGD